MQPAAGQHRASVTLPGQYLPTQQQLLQPVQQLFGQSAKQPAALQYQQFPVEGCKPSFQQQTPTSQPEQQQEQQQQQLRQRNLQLQAEVMQQQREMQEQQKRKRERQQAEQQRREQEQRASAAATAKRRQDQRQQCLEHNMQCSRLLQLPEGILPRIAAWLTKQECVMFAQLVLPQDSAAATEVLGTIHTLRFCREDLRTSEDMHNKKGGSKQHAPFHCTSGSAHVHYSKCPQPMRDTPSFVAALQNLRSLSLELDPTGRKKAGDSSFDPRLPRFARLIDSSRLTSLQLTLLATNQRERRVQEAAMQLVAQLSSLKTLAFVAQGRRSFNTFADGPSANGFAAFSGLTGLQCLQLQYSRSSLDLGLGTLSGLTKLTELQLLEHRPMSFDIRPESTCQLSQLRPLLAVVRLQKFTLRGVTCYHQHCPLAVRPDDLRVLDITGCVRLELFPQTTPPSPQCTTLQELRAGSCRELRLGGSGAGHAAVEGHASSVAAALASSLTLLDINDADSIPWGLKFVSQLTSLKSLNIAGTWLGKQAIAEAGAAAAAAGVMDDSSTLDNLGTFEVIAKHLTSLTSLTMGCLASVYAAKYIIPADELLWATRLVHLEHLTIHGSVFEGSGWQARASKLATCLAECTALKQLTLRGCGFDAGDSKQVSQLLQQSGVGARGQSVVLHSQFDRAASMSTSFDGTDIDDDIDFEEDDYGYDDSDWAYGLGMEDGWCEGLDPYAYQDEFGGFYPDGPFGEVYYAAER